MAIWTPVGTEFGSAKSWTLRDEGQPLKDKFTAPATFKNRDEKEIVVNIPLGFPIVEVPEPGSERATRVPRSKCQPARLTPQPSASARSSTRSWASTSHSHARPWQLRKEIGCIPLAGLEREQKALAAKKEEPPPEEKVAQSQKKTAQLSKE